MRGSRRLAMLMVALFAGACGLDLVGTGASSSSVAPAASGGSEAGGPPTPPGSDDGSAPAPGGDALAPEPPPCTDTKTDPHNCGECGHDCLGAACDNSMCAATPVVTGRKGPHGLAVDGTYVYWAENTSGYIYKTTHAPIVSPIEVFNTTQAPRALALAQGRLYWVEQTKVRSVAIDGSSPSAGRLIAGGSAVAADTRVYYNSLGVFDNVYGAPLDLSTDETVGDESDTPSGIAVDAKYVYWTVTASKGVVRRRLRDGSASAETLAGDEDPPESIAVDANRVYWTTKDEIRAYDLSTKKLTTLAKSEGRPRSVVVSGAALYWLETSKGTLRRLTLRPDAKPFTLADQTPQDDVVLNTAIAVGPEYVYWLSSKSPSGFIKRVAK